MHVVGNGLRQFEVLVRDAPVFGELFAVFFILGLVHAVGAAPALGIDDVGVGGGLVDVVGDGQLAARLFVGLVGKRHVLVVQLIALRVSQRQVGAQQAAGNQHGLGHARRFHAVGIRPAHHNFLFLPAGAQLLLQGHDVAHALAGVLFVVQAVDDGDGGGFANLVHDVAGHAIFLQVIQAHHQSVQVAAQHKAGVLPGLFVLALHVVLAVILRVAAQLRHARLERNARAGRGLRKNHAQRLVFQQLVLGAHSVLALQVERHVQDGLDLFARVIHQGNEVFSAHVCSHKCFTSCCVKKISILQG